MPSAASQGASAQLDMQVAALEPVSGVRGDPDDEVEVASRGAVAAVAALAGQPDPLAVGHARPGW